MQNYELKWPCVNLSMNPAFMVTTYIKKYGTLPLVNILYDRYAIAVMKDDVVIGHLPRALSRICSL